MTFPTAHSQVYRNEAGEVLGWDNPSYDDGAYDPDDYLPDDYDDGDYDEDPIDEQYGDDGDLRDHYGDPSEADPADHQCGDGCECTDQTGDDLDDYKEESEPQEPDDAEVSWQEYGRHEAYADAEMARHDDDPNPYHGDYSEM